MYIFAHIFNVLYNILMLFLRTKSMIYILLKCWVFHFIHMAAYVQKSNAHISSSSHPHHIGGTH